MLTRAMASGVALLIVASAAAAQQPANQGQPANQLATRVGDVLTISAVVSSQSGPDAPSTSCMIITYPDAPFGNAPNVLLTTSSFHFVASAIWVESRRFGLCVDRKTPAPAEPLHVYMLIQGAVPDGTSTAGPLHLTSTPVKGLDELKRLRGQ